MREVEIRVGASWRRDLAHLSRLYEDRGGPEQLDLVCVLDVIDIVIGDDNITAPIPRDSIFPLVEDLLDALRALASGARTRAIVRFREAPWEVILKVAGPDRIDVSLLGTGLDPCVVIHNRPAPASALFAAAGGAARELVDELVALDPGFARNPLIARLGRLAQALNGAGPLDCQHLRPHRPNRASGRVEVGPMSLIFELDLGHPDLLACCGDEPLDLHALLCPGQILLDVEPSAPLALGAGYPLLTARRLLDEAAALVRCAPGEAPRPLSMPGRAALLEPRLDPEAPGCWLVTWRPARPAEGLLPSLRRRSEQPPERSLTCSMGPADLVALASGLVEAVAEFLISVNPVLEGEERLRSLRREAARLVARHREAALGELIFDGAERPESARAQVRLAPQEQSEPVEAPPRFALGEMRRLSMRCRWSLSAASIRWDEVALLGDKAIVSTRDALLGVDLRTGEARFSVPHDGSAVTWGVGGGALLGLGRGELRQIEPEGGQQRWSAPVGSGWGRIVGVGDYRARDRRPWSVVVARQGALAVDADGAIVWRAQRAAGRTTHAIFTAERVIQSTDEGGVVARDPVDGAVLWRVRLAARGARLLGLWASTLWASARDRAGVQLVALDLATGRRQWSRELPGGVLGAGVAASDAVLLSVEEDEGSRLMSLSLDGRVRWSRILPGSGLGGPTAPLVWGARAFTQTDSGALWAVSLGSGKLLWSVELGESESLINLPPQRQGGVLVAAGAEVAIVDPGTGALRHRLDALPRHPAWLRVHGEGLIVGDPGLASTHGSQGEDVLSRFEVGHFLAVVK